MIVRNLAIAALLAVSALPAKAAVIEVVTGARIQTMSFTNGIFGQSFLAPGTDLLSVGVQFATLNPASARNTVTVSILNGAGLTGPVLATRTITPVNAPRTGPFVFTNIDFTGTTLTAGAAYTLALLNNGAGAGNGIVFGPSLVPFTGPDAYAGGRLFFTGNAFNGCATVAAGCDLDFRVEATTPVAVIPEPATWGLMMAGFGLVGAVARRRRPVQHA